VAHPSEVLSVGEEVKVYVLDVDREQERAGPSRKRVLVNPWAIVTERLDVSQFVDGTVMGVKSLGAFVDLGEGVEGLVRLGGQGIDLVRREHQCRTGFG
jgi:small subunit ribosomal protein S1